MKRNTLNIVRVSAGLMMALSAPCAWALSVSPARTEITLAPGAMTKAVMTVSNPHDEAFNVELSEKPWFIYPENKAIQVADWLKLPRRKHFRLKPGKSREITLTILCPKEAVGELMGMVSVSYQGMQASMITPMISSPVYLQIKGTEKLAGEILAVGAGTRNGYFQVGAQVKATGNVRLRPSGMIRLLNDQQQTVAEYAIPETNPVFPGAKLDCAGRGSETPPSAGRYTLVAEIHSGTLTLHAEQKILVKANGDVEMEKEALKS